jgi:SulP family sulfate permease
MKLKSYSFKLLSHLKADLTGGALAAIIGLPMGLAFGVQSGLGPQAGIITAIVLAIIASFFGGTKTLITDPTGPMTVVAATVVSLGVAQAGDIQHAWPLIVGTFVLAGVFELIFGILDFGKYVKFMPYPVLSGFMAGIGVIIISVQLFPILGYASPKGFLTIVSKLGQPISHPNLNALALGAFTIAVIYLFPLITKKAPSILVALITGTILSVVFKMEVPVIGRIPRELPSAHFADLLQLKWADIEYIITPAIMLAGLGVIDSLLTSVVADNLTKTRHNSRWTVIGQGLGNLLTGLLGGIPGAGATMGTVTNIKAGAQTKLSGIMKGVFLLLIILGISEYVQYIPMSVLAGILITIGIGIIDTKGLKMLFRIPVQDAVVWVIVLFVTLFDNLLDAVGIGFALSSILFIGRMAKNMTKSQSAHSLQEVIDHNHLPQDLSEKIFVKQLEGPLFFGFADRFRTHCESICDVLAIILVMDRIPFLDQSGIVTLESAIQGWHEKGIQVYISGAQPEVMENLKKTRIIPGLIPSQHLYSNFDECVLSIQSRINGKLSSRENSYESVLLDKHILENRMTLMKEQGKSLSLTEEY